MRTSVIFLAMVPSLLMPPPSLAGEPTCANPPATLVVDAAELIGRAPRIVIAEGAQWRGKLPGRDQINRPAREGAVSMDRADAHMPMYSLTVVEELKGKGPDTIMVIGAPPFTAEQQAALKAGRSPWRSDEEYQAAINPDFSGHGDPSFWDDPAAGRSKLDETCGVKPMFLAGSRYLVILGSPHVKAYEVVRTPDDKWLAFVREQLTGSANQSR